MLKTFLLIATMLELYPQGWLASFKPQPSQMAAEYSVQFQQPTALDIGAPVLMNGHIIGKVAAPVISAESSNESAASQPTTTKIAVLKSEARAIRDGAIVLVSSRISPKSARATQFVEILNPGTKRAKSARPSKPLTGFGSFHEFWSSPAGSAFDKAS